MFRRRREQPTDLTPYVDLVSGFVERGMSAAEYTARYFSVSKADKDVGTAEEREVLGKLYGDADFFEPDPEIRAELEWTIDEDELRKRAAGLLERLRGMQAQRER